MSLSTQTERPGDRHTAERRERMWPYAVLGIYLGIVFTRAEVVSWFRIQEMFRFQDFHMYGIIGSAVAVGAIGVWAIRRFQVKSYVGWPMQTTADFQKPGYQFWLGGGVFGLGWGLLGACPGPIYVLIGNGVSVMVVALGSAMLGVWTYGTIRHRLPHS